MGEWNPGEYLKYVNERSRPAADLIYRIDHPNPAKILDVGCGPGNSTLLLWKKWPQASLTGIDNSPAMLEQARSNSSPITWVLADAGESLAHLGHFDLIFSNAVLQWLPHNNLLLPKLFKMLNNCGVLAAQVPYVEDMPIHKIIDLVAGSPKWCDHFRNLSSSYHLYSAEYYYNVLCDLTQRVDLWETRYFHILNGHDDILQWIASTGLRPYIEHLPVSLKDEFERDIRREISLIYPVKKNGKVLFPFHRIFFIAYKAAQ